MKTCMSQKDSIRAINRAFLIPRIENFFEVLCGEAAGQLQYAQIKKFP